jgi:hypothetical protein
MMVELRCNYATSDFDRDEMKRVDRLEVRREWSDKSRLLSISRSSQRACAATNPQKVKSCAERWIQMRRLSPNINDFSASLFGFAFRCSNGSD